MSGWREVTVAKLADAPRGDTGSAEVGTQKAADREMAVAGPHAAGRLPGGDGAGLMGWPAVAFAAHSDRGAAGAGATGGAGYWAENPWALAWRQVACREARGRSTRVAG
jgi:hypothetical protein